MPEGDVKRSTTQPTFELGQCVRAARDLPEVDLAAGALGVVVALLETPLRAYEIEFVDDGGATIATIPIKEEDLTPLEPSARTAPAR